MAKTWKKYVMQNKDEDELGVTYRTKVGALGDVVADSFALLGQRHAVKKSVSGQLSRMIITMEKVDEDGKDQKAIFALSIDL